MIMATIILSIQESASVPSTPIIQRRSFLAAPRARQARFLFALADMLFDQCRACGKDRRKSEKQTADDGPEASSDEACNHGHRSTEPKSDEVPVRLTKSGRLELNDHES
jgi:hypothetical protein